MKGKVVIVTGGSKGIGASAVRQFHAKGARVAIFDVDAVAGQALAEDLGHDIVFVACDVSKHESVRRAIDVVLDELGEIDILINNAGVLSYSTVVDATEDEWDTVVGTNLKGAYLCAKFAIPCMIKNGQGVVINVSSVQAFITQEKVAAYTASKTGMLGLTRSIAVDFGPTVRCVAVCPGTIDTPMFEDAIHQSGNPEEVRQECIDMHLTKSIGQPDDVASMIVYLASDSARFITGQAFRVDGGLGVYIAGSQRD